jgi:intron-binding protein aquarius
MPSWMQEVFLGYGDAAGACYKNLSNKLKSIDFRDTFLNWQHLIESLPGKVIVHPSLHLLVLIGYLDD